MPRVLKRLSSAGDTRHRRGAAAVRSVARPSGPLALLAQLAGRPYPVMAGFLGIASFMVFRGGVVMFRGVFMVLRGFAVVLRGIFRHL